MAAIPQIYVNPLVGESFAIDIDPANGKGATGGVDLSTVSAAAWAVQKPDGTIISWTPIALSNQTATTLRMTHNFVGSSDAPTTGPYVIEVTLTIPAGQVRLFPDNAVQVVPRMAIP